MPSLLIRDVPEAVHLELVRHAERNRRSKEKHALFLIEGGLRGRKPLPETLAQAAKLRGECKRPVALSEVLALTEEAH
jgi:hypothetical protein